MQFAFGSGAAWATPLTDNTGTTITVPTPLRVGVIQELSIDLTWTSKQLFGTNQYPLAVGRGTAKSTGTIKWAQINSELWNALVIGTPASGVTSGTQTIDYRDVTGTAIPGTPYQITPTPPSSGTWLADLGVVDANGIQLTKVAASPSTGQYSVAAGVYTFAAADTTHVVYIDYTYTASITNSKTVVATNPLLGYVPVFQLDVLVPYNNKNTKFTLYQCVGDKLAFATKLEDFIITETTFGFFANPSGNPFKYSVSE
jgi:hypothetical protein